MTLRVSHLLRLSGSKRKKIVAFPFIKISSIEKANDRIFLLSIVRFLY